jgi:gliding motility-associated-like protein
MAIKTYIFWILLLSIFTINLCAQQCDGNLGENIFLDGNFGSGAANIPSTDPGIAPGYNYITNPPPIDGSYTITNDITPWQFEWGWSDIQDNSNDPQGYMMVVNASFEPGLFYEKEIEGLCGNTLYEFSADVFNLHNGSNVIRPNVSFLINDEVQFTTGNVPENGMWNTYGFTFSTAPGETIVKLSLANNAPGGNGNDLALDNISFRACGPEALILPETVQDVCVDGEAVFLDATINGEQFPNPAIQWQQSFDGGITWVDLAGENSTSYLFNNLGAGSYYYRYKLASSDENLSNPFCQIISNIKIVEVIPKFTDITDSICEGLSVQIGESIYSDSGVSVDTLLNRLGCDSIITFDLTVFPDQGITIISEDTPPICSNSLDGSLEILDIQNDYEPSTIFFNGIPAQNLINNLSAGDYNLRIVDDLGCELETIVTIESPIPFIIDLGEDIEVNLGNEITIDLEHNYELLNTIYQSIYNIQCVDVCTEINILPLTSNSIIVEATSENGCITNDTINIRVNRDIKVYRPTVFTPNGDKINDEFNIYSQELITNSIIKFSIYDRWGNRVHHIENANPQTDETSWDGKFNGKNASQGIYSYIAEIEFIDFSTEVFSGTIMLIR